MLDIALAHQRFLKCHDRKIFESKCRSKGTNDRIVVK